jgi:hypothetical protein
MEHYHSTLKAFKSRIDRPHHPGNQARRHFHPCRQHLIPLHRLHRRDLKGGLVLLLHLAHYLNGPLILSSTANAFFSSYVIASVLEHAILLH